MASWPYPSDHWGFASQGKWVPSLFCASPTPVSLGPHRSFAHAIGDVEGVPNSPNGGDDHDESPASWYHQPCPIH